MRAQTFILCACGVLFTPNGPNQTRCNACRFPASTPPSRKHRYCIRCGSLFAPRGSRDVYCSDLCHKLTPAPLKPCLHCGILFPPQRNQRYCLDCQPYFTARAQLKARKKARKPARACARCGTVFTPRRADQVACSAACRQSLWATKHRVPRPPRPARVPMTAAQIRRARLERVLRKHGVQTGEN